MRAGEYVVASHAANELDDDEISILDVESLILTGEAVETQRDASSASPSTSYGEEHGGGDP